MNYLVLDTSSVTACCGVATQEGRVLSGACVDVPLTHSETLMPMIEGVLRNASLTMDQVDVLAVCAGPGSFTGVKIGVSAAKGLAFERQIPCAAVSTLAALAHNFEGISCDCLLVPVMDARCRQVYTASFLCEGGEISRLTADEALPLEDAAGNWKNAGRGVVFTGDGARLCADYGKGLFPCRTAPFSLRAVTPYGIARAAEKMRAAGALVAPKDLLPLYLRAPQAERELRKRHSASV